MDIRHTLVAMLVGTALAACSGSSGTAIDDEAAARESGNAGTSGLDENSYQDGSRFDDDSATGSAAVLDERVVYFDFDKSDVKSNFQRVLEAHGRYLANNPDVQVRLEGHADERGSREYNIGLGEDRAQAVRQLLLLHGVDTAQLSTISYGEERPAVSRTDEGAWSLNRRVELIYIPSS